MAKLQWISWYQPTADYRPLTFPPNQAILGWWCTGESANGDATLCALVRADSEEKAQDAVKHDWPEADEWRFCEERGNTELGSRFPPNDWMKERMSYNDQ